MGKKKAVRSFDRPPVSQRVQIGGIAIVSVLVILLMLWNTVGLRRALENSTIHYVWDVSYQLTNDISARLNAFRSDLEQLADSIPRLESGEAVEEFLDRKTRVSGFDGLAVFGRDGSAAGHLPGLEQPMELPGILDAFEGGSTVTYVEGQHILFATPAKGEEQHVQVLAGVRQKENMQALIQLKSFGGSGLSCIVDSSGQVVISPTDLKPFLQLDDLFQADTDSRTTEEILRMQGNLSRQSSGVFQFTASDGSRLVMAYHPLGVNGWFLLTLVSADLVSGEADAYVLRTFAIVGGITAIFVLILIYLLRFYRSNRKRLEKIAFTDSLTGGMNNAAFQQAYQELAQDMAPETYAVVMLNVKGFKLINENFGVLAGDDTLKFIDEKLRRNIRAGELAARSDADRFFLCLHEYEPEAIQRRIDEIVQDIESFSQYTDIQYYLVLELGAFLIDDPGLDIAIIQDRARMACQYQSEPGKCAFYDCALTQQLKREQEYNAQFDQAIENHEFQVFLQPKVRLADGGLGGAEALVRWFRPQKGMVPPCDFIPLFERNGNICKLDLYMFEEVCRLLCRWREEGRPLIPVSVNLSRVHFKNLNFLRAFSRLKEAYSIPDGVVEFELTESIFFDEQQREMVKNAIEEMHRLGFLCSLDDFGVGFSALALLKELDADVIKMDRQFFGDISNPKAQKIIAAFVELAGRLGIKTVSEGIETREQLDFLKEIGCDMVQGYIFSKPLPIPEFETWCQHAPFQST